ncbi:hypothetical protein MalM25_11570 [Planctomycetes bacterium MalM25]|nr:hypothetical protein MalM25_11570 [Planctomycetes bacterium MalM25]
MIRLRSLLLIALTASLARAQSDPGLFDQVIDTPPATEPAEVTTSNTQLNVYAGARLPWRFTAGREDGSSENLEINLLGGQATMNPRAYAGVTFNVYEGQIGGAVAWEGSTYNILGGTVLSQFNAEEGSTVNISGGEVTPDFRAVGGTVNISGGEVGRLFNTFSGSVVNITGGSVGHSFQAYRGGRVRIAGGEVGSNFQARSGSLVTMTGGSLGPGLTIGGSDAVVTVSGGSLSDNAVVYPNAELHLIGDEFRLDGVLMPGLQEPGDSVLVTDRQRRVLTGELTDGNGVRFVLDDVFQTGRPWFHPRAIVRLTVGLPVPEPSAAWLLAVGLLPLAVRRRH